jgi:hypothetical protein
MEKVVVIFGAGATKACGGPLTNEILPDALASLGRRPQLSLVEEFLAKQFRVPMTGRRPPDRFPPLPLLLSIVDTAIDREDAFGPDWPPARLRQLRGAIEYAIFALLELRLQTVAPHYREFFRGLFNAVAPERVTVISLNYDLIADNAMAAIAEQTQRPGLPDYGIDIATDAYREIAKVGKLLKLHGSLHWLYCPGCRRLDLGIAESGVRTVKMLRQLYGTRAMRLEHEYDAGRGTPCPVCGTGFRPVLITPTHLKDYRNPHIARTWYRAEEELREATRAIFIGYGMPDDDVEVIYLCKRALAKLDPKAITVVEYATGRAAALGNNPVGLRYRALFGDGIDWQPGGFQVWAAKAVRRGFRPPARRRTAAA